MFSACQNLDVNEGCKASTGIWGDSRDTLTLYLVSSLTAMDAVEVKLNFTNAETSQDGLCSIVIEIHAEELGCQIAPAPIMSASELRGTSKEALRIHSGNAVCFPVKLVSQSTSSPGLHIIFNSFYIHILNELHTRSLHLHSFKGLHTHSLLSLHTLHILDHSFINDYICWYFLHALCTAIHNVYDTHVQIFAFFTLSSRNLFYQAPPTRLL
jgi:hypothetical protein